MLSQKRSQTGSEKNVVTRTRSKALTSGFSSTKRILGRLSSQLYKRKGGGGHGNSSHGGSTHGSSTHGSSTHGSSGDDEGGSSSSSSSTSKGGGSSSKGSPATRHGASPVFTNSKGSQGFTLSKSGKTTATAYSDGGGSRYTIGSGTTFSGRLAGGSDRVS